MNNSADAQNFSQKTVPLDIISNYYKPEYEFAYNGSNMLLKNKTFLESRDHTKVLQHFIDENSIILLPDITLFVNREGLKIGSDKKIIFQKSTKIKFLGPANGRYSDIIKIYNAKNIEIINPVVIGSKNSGQIQNGQWSAGISILNSSNIKILNPKITETFGDGIFIGSEDGGFCQYVTINGGWIDSARRNGISITSAKDILVENILISNTSGHDPESGVDIEPSWEKDILNNVSLKDIYTFNNKAAGIAINLNSLSMDKIQDVKETTILIDGHTDVGSNNAFLTSLNAVENKYDTTGNIVVKNAVWKSSRDMSYWKTPNKQSINITFSNIKLDKNRQKEFENTVKISQNMKLIK